ncbi:TetR/AcrR family transcriptional regulator [Pseudofrankia sp. BMG5.37]|uniref:TetR/AcrR family transcriptional regulator n=1 Tax=Pseudofrankia sp. BMG5.37 TaxID=3050035 RepID=UPI002893B249|nr:TetR/AcrR family transcriptional regulator [Pseudofrankia sp. BMG5.37]MDT3440190.1 TetR/AcrR family transcriptional regulator [Pseudofrankia sp. BMG5.37]
MSEGGQAAPATRVRVRDPERRERILAASAELIAARGYHAVTMADIGEAAGIVGSGIYRHFNGKSEVLAALLEGVMDNLWADAMRIVDAGADPATTLSQLIAAQVDFSIDRRVLVALYLREAATLPPDRGRGLRRMQRRYIEEWVTNLHEARPELNEAEARTLVHAAIGAIQSVVNHDSGLPRGDLAAVLTGVAHACLGLSRMTT